MKFALIFSCYNESAVATFDLLSNYLRVLLLLGQDPNLRIRDLAAAVGITDRAVQRIIDQLEEDNYLSRARIGRRSTYMLNDKRRIDEFGRSVGEFLDFVATKHGEPARKAMQLSPAQSPRKA